MLNLFTFRHTPLQLQTRLNRAAASAKKTTIYHELAADDDDIVEIDTQPTTVSKDELAFFTREMNTWMMLEKPWQEFLTQYSEKVMRETTKDVENAQFIHTLSSLKNIHHGVNNSMTHLCGQIISTAINESKTSHV